MIATIVVLAIIVIILGIVCVWLYNNYKTIQIKLLQLQNEQSALKNYNLTTEERENEIIRLKQQKERCEIELSIIQAQLITEEKNNKILLEQSLADLTAGVAAKRLEEEEIRQSCQILIKQYKTWEVQSNSIQATLAAHREELANTERDLVSLKQQHKIATLRLEEEDSGRILAYNEIDLQLTNTLDTLKQQYPNLSDAFSDIQWKHIWQTKFQAMTNDLLKSDKCGIYRIWVREDNQVKSYVGQAKKIRERWSQHIKKMLGVDKADNKKFYSAVKPYNAHFEIIEECTEAELNSREKYWIDYYNCVENGFNTKGG